MSVREELQSLLTAARSGGDVDPKSLVEISERLRSNPDQIAAKDAKAVIAMLDELATWSHEQQANTARELSQIGNGRKALNGYNHLQGARTAQKLFRQA